MLLGDAGVAAMLEAEFSDIGLLVIPLIAMPDIDASPFAWTARVSDSRNADCGIDGIAG